jgi:hypothetical protein
LQLARGADANAGDGKLDGTTLHQAIQGRVIPEDGECLEN